MSVISSRSLLNAKPGDVFCGTVIIYPHVNQSITKYVDIEVEIPFDYPNNLPKVKVIGNPSFVLPITDKDGYIIMEEKNGPNFSDDYTIDKYFNDYIVTSMEEAF